MLNLARDRKGKKNITLSTSGTRAIFITGKRGSGKSYTLGRLVEEYHRAGNHLIVVVDPLAVFWSTAMPEDGQEPLPVRVLVPGSIEDALGPLAPAMEARGVELTRLQLNASDLTPDAWLAIFDLSISSPQAIALARAIRSQAGQQYTIPDLITAIGEDEHAADSTKNAICNRLDGAAAWGVFSTSYRPITEVLRPGAINVVDVSAYDPGPQSIRNLVVRLLAEQLFRARFAARRAETLGLPADIPPVLLALDEAHDFCPATGGALAKRALIRIGKEGRQPGLSLAIATQQPSALSFSLISQCDALIVHHLTLEDDIKVARRLASRLRWRWEVT